MVTPKIFMTYHNAGHNPLSDELKEKYRNTLIFDTNRHSIYAQEKEFGYICNTSISFDENDNKVTLDIQDGQFTFNKYTHIIPTEFDYTVSNATFDGTSYLLECGEKVKFTSFDYDYVTSYDMNYIQITYTDNTYERNLTINDNIKSDVKHLNAAIEVQYEEEQDCFLTMYINDKQARKYNIQASSYTNNTHIMWKYRFAYGNVEADDITNVVIPENTADLLTTGDVDNFKTTGIVLADNKWGTNVNNRILCSNIEGQLMWLVCPDFKEDDKSIVGVLGGASSERFIKMSYFNYTLPNSDVQIKYNLYISTSDNWNKNTLYII